GGTRWDRTTDQAIMSPLICPAELSAPRAYINQKGRTCGLFVLRRLLSLLIEQALQQLAPRRMAQLAQRLGLDLAYALARHIELLADLFQRVVSGHLDAEAHPQHLRFARRQRIE